MTTHGAIHWTELMTRDPAGAAAFFETLLGWRIIVDPMGPEMPYRVAMLNDKAVCGIFDMSGDEWPPEIPSHWMTYFAVDDADAAAARVAEEGGEIVRPAFDVPRVGRIVIVRDPTGGVVGLMTPSPNAPA